MSQLLDTFLTIFQSDTKSVTEGNKKADQSADDLIKKLKDTDKVAADTGKSFKDMVVGAAKSIAALVAVQATVGGVFSSAENILAINQTAEALGESIENVDAFGRAAVSMGGDAQGARDSLTDMAEKIGEALSDTESGAAKAFKALKIGLKDSQGNAKTAVAGLLDLAGAVEGLSKSEAVFKIKELGITDNRTVEMVIKGRKALEDMIKRQKEQGVITKENAEQAKQLTFAWGSLTAGFSQTTMGISTALMPALTKVIEWLTTVVDWANDHKDLLVGFFGAVAFAVTAFYLPAMIQAAIATTAATWPIIAIIAAVLAFSAAWALLYDDVMNFIDGNDSLIGQIFEKYPLVKQIVFGIIDAFRFMGQVVGGVWETLVLGFKQMLGFIMRGIDQIRSGVSTVAQFFGIGGGEEGAGGAAGAMEGMDAANAAIGAANASPLNPVSSNALSNSVGNKTVENNVSIGELTVQTQATDAQGMAQGASGALDKQLMAMQAENASGIER